MKIMKRTYTELVSIPSFEERFEYAKIGGTIGAETFGYDRYLNQLFYRSPEWRKFRQTIIARDLACDLAFPEFEIAGQFVVVHHLNPITIEDLGNRSQNLFDPDNAVCVSELTHKAIHYGDLSLLPIRKPVERMPNDTCPWR